MMSLAAAVEMAVAEHTDTFMEESRHALAADAAGQEQHVVPLEPVLQGLLLVLVGIIVAHLADQLRGGKLQNRLQCTCGGGLRYKVTRDREWGSVVGALRFPRAYFYCETCGATRYPLDVVWELRESGDTAKSRVYLTPRASARLAMLGAVMSYGKAAKLFAQSVGVRISSMLVWRTVQRVGKKLRAQDAAAGVKRAALATPGKGRQVLRWLVSADGIMVGFWRDSRRRRRAEGAPEIRRRKGIAWKEAKVGVVALLDKEGDVVRGSQWYVAGMALAPAFRQTLWLVAQARGVLRKDVVAVVTDGAKWLRALVTRYFTWAVGIRDFFHASEHLGAMAEALYGEGSRRARRWHGRMARRLKRGEIDVLIGEWERWKGTPKDPKRWAKELAYFSTQREAMRYQEFQDGKLPIGSGCMEAGCKTVVAERGKISGARWTVEGFENLLAIRVCYLNGISPEALPLSC